MAQREREREREGEITQPCLEFVTKTIFEGNVNVHQSVGFSAWWVHPRKLGYKPEKNMVKYIHFVHWNCTPKWLVCFICVFEICPWLLTNCIAWFPQSQFLPKSHSWYGLVKAWNLGNYYISLTWIKAIWGSFPLLTMIIVRSQWGRYNLSRWNMTYRVKPFWSHWSHPAFHFFDTPNPWIRGWDFPLRSSGLDLWRP